MKKMIFLFCFFILSISLVSAAVLDFECGDYKLTFNDGNYEMLFSYSSAEWPLVADRAMIGSFRLRGAQRVRSQSLFSVTAIAPQSNRIITLNSDVADEVSYSKIDNGITITYSFDDGIGFSSSIFLREDGLHVSIDTESFVESEELFITSIQFLPFFSASSVEDKGYFVIPDGCGAVVNFNNGKGGTYNKSVYGDDMVDSREVRVTSSLPVILPMIGIDKEGYGCMIAVASSSAAMANIVCSTANTNNPYNIAFFQFNIRTSIEESIASDASQIVYESPRVFDGTFEVTYTACGEDGYASMAETFKDLYLDYNKADNKAAVITVKCAENKDMEVLGIPMPFSLNHRVIGYSDILDFLLSVSDPSSLIVNFEDWNSRVLRGHNQENFKFVPSLGRKKEMEKLVEYASQHGILLSACVSPIRTTSREKGSVRDLSGRPSRIYEYNPASSIADQDSAEYLLNVRNVDFVFDEGAHFLSSYIDVGNFIYSDFSDEQQMSKDSYTSVVEDKLNEIESYLVYGGNYYSLANAIAVLSAPYISSRANIFDYEIPFYEIVLSGLVSYSFDAINRSDNPMYLILKSMETGACLNYEISSDDDIKYIINSLDSYIGDISLISSVKIVSHERINDNLSRTVFDNGYVVTTDYASLSYSIEEVR